MDRRPLVVLVLSTLAAFGCPGPKPATTPAKTARPDDARQPLVWRVSKSGLGFRISNADTDADSPEPRSVAPSTPLGQDEARKIMARLPKLEADADAAKEFSLRDRSIPAPRTGKTVSDPFPPPAAPPPSLPGAQGPLVLERHAPEGDVPLAPHLTMTFSQPMVAVTSHGDLAEERPSATLVPQPEGKWRWLGTRTLMFQPTKRFPMATEYVVEVPAGTKSKAGGVLAKAERWTFTTPAPTLKTSHPQGSSEPRQPLVFLEFDQAIDRAKMLSAIELSGRGRPVPVVLAAIDEVEANDAVRRLSQRAEPDRWLAFRPQASLPTATSFTVRVKAGAPSAEGPRRTDKDQSFSFSTYGPLKVVHQSCAMWRTDKCVPLAPFVVSFSNGLDRKTFDKSMVTVKPEIPNMKVEAAGNMVTIAGRTKGRTKYEVTINAALKDVHGQAMDADAKVAFAVGSAEPMLFPSEREMIVLDPAAPKAYPVYTINEPGLRTRLFAVSPEDYPKYIAFAQEWERPRKLSPPGRLVFDRVVKPKAAADELATTMLDLGPALASGLGQALVVVEPTRTVPKGSPRAELHVWVQSTELGVSAFVERDQTTGWVTRLADGAPLDGVDLSLLGGAPVRTNKDGLAAVALADKPSPLLVARRGKDVAIAPEGYGGAFAQGPVLDVPRWLVFDDRGIYKPGEEVRVKGYLRRAVMMRGGDLEAFAGISGKKVSYVVRDPRWAQIGTGVATFDDAGSFDFAFKLPGNANLGQAQIELSASDLGAANATHTFQIQEFRRPEFEVSARSSEGPHFVGKHAIATVSASYYAGGGLAAAPVEWTVTRETVGFTPEGRGEFHFGPPPVLYGSWRGGLPKIDVKTENWTSQTDPQGVHRIRLDFEAVDPPYPMKLDLAAHVVDVNRQQWAGRTSMFVHPADRYAGLRLKKNFVHAGEPIAVDVLVSDIDGAAIPNAHVVVKTARLEVEQRGEEFEEKEVDTKTCEIDTPASGGQETASCALPTNEGGQYRVWAIVTDVHGRKNQTATKVWVMGSESPKDRRANGDSVTIVPGKKEYEPGALADLLVIAPFAPAEGILTVRRQGIVHLERFTMTRATHALKVKLEDAHVPNVEVRVDLVGAKVRLDQRQQPDPSLPKQPAFAQGSVELKVLPLSRTLAVKAVAKKAKLEPGGSTAVDVEVKDPSGGAASGAQVSLVVVDESVLALTGYATPDPISVFYSPRSSDVHDVGIRDRVVLAEPSLVPRAGGAMPSSADGLVMMEAKMAPGAAPPPPPRAPQPTTAAPARQRREAAKDSSGRDEETSALPADAPIRMRSDFAALALFSPRVKTDAKGRATIPVKLPDNLTRYRVMAVAAAGDKFFGATESTITARLPIMVRPSAPRFLNFGDRFELPVVIQNQTDAPADASVVVRATNASLDAPAAKRVRVPPNDRVEVRFGAGTVKAGTARFQIGVASGGFSDASQVEMPVYTPATSEAFATYGEIDQGAIAQSVKMPSSVFPQFGGLEVSTSSTQLSALTDAVLYLVRYPFECNEQLASRVLAIAALRDVLTAFKAEGLPSSEAMLASMKTDFEKLKRRQHGTGGWGFWQEQPWPYLTVHVAHALVRAKEKGFSPDPAMLERSKNYLRRIEAFIPAWYGEDARRALVAYALYVRKLMGDADPARARGLVAEAGGVDKLPIEAVGWIWPTIADDKSSQGQNEQIRRHVANRVTETAGAAHFVSGYKDANWVLLHSDRRADGVLLESMIGDQPQSTLIPKLVKGLLDHRKAGRWMNTQENAFVLLALDRYFHKYENVTPDFVARVWLGDRFAGQHAFKGRTTERHHVGIPMSFLASEMGGGPQNLVVAKDGPGRLYYRVGMQYAPTDLKLPPADHGFVVTRVYEGAERPEDVRRDDGGTWHVKAGTKVRVRLTMVAQARRYHVALVDPIPAGLEPMNPSLAVTGELPKDPKDEATRGRYWFWKRTWYEHQNMRDERVEAFASLLWDGVWEYSYVARATTPGTFVVPPAKAEEMYAPETFGRSGGDRLVVE